MENIEQSLIKRACELSVMSVTPLHIYTFSHSKRPL